MGRKSSTGGKLDIFWNNTVIKLEELLSKNLISNKQFYYIMQSFVTMGLTTDGWCNTLFYKKKLWTD